ncbi:MAG: glycoside hydrolase family 3 N-terminal domain-containing protein [Bacteroidota bacterium]
MRGKFLLFLIWGALLVTIKSHGQAIATEQNARQWVDSVYQSLTEEQRIGQLFMVAAYSNRTSEHEEELSELIEKYNIGGLIFFQGGPLRQAHMQNRLQNKAQTPLLIGMDAEWGLAMRLDSTLKYPRQMTLGAAQNDSLIYQMGRDIGAQCKRLGVHINFAPVADINNNPQNPVINSRSFGENKTLVTSQSMAYMQGLQSQGILACAKHFPGHGDTNSDSHKTLPTVKQSQARIDSLELYPFQRLIDSGVASIMVAHLSIPSLEPDLTLPSTLSKRIVTDLLKEKMNFQGLIFTDALNMRGVTLNHKPGDIEAEALLAGNDVLLFPMEVSKAVKQIKHDLKQGIIPERRIEESCKKILLAKYKAGLAKPDAGQVAIQSLYNDLNPIAHDLTRRELLQQSLTLLQNKKGLIPFQSLDTLTFASVVFGESHPIYFQDVLSRYVDMPHFVANSYTTDSLMMLLKQYDVVIGAFSGTHNTPSSNYGVVNGHIRFLEQLGKHTSVAATFFANPYCLEQVKSPELLQSIVIAYQDDEDTQSFAAQALFGALPFQGTLPVSASPLFLQGKSIKTEAINRLRYALPEEVGLSGKQLQKIDSLMYGAIRDKATPGGQILIARDGAVVYRKAFGHYTYLQEQPVTLKSIYDVASVTKIAATVPAIMHFYDQGKIDLNAPLSDYLTRLDSTNKRKMRVKDILAHQSGLTPWIPFYLQTLKGFYPKQGIANNQFSEEFPYKVGKHLYLARNYRFVEDMFYATEQKGVHTQVARDLYIRDYMRDTIFKLIDNSDLLSDKRYRYSDLGFYYFSQALEKMSMQPLEQFVEEKFYAPLGANRTGYLPLRRFDKKEIVPTENDQLFRQQLLQGHVHDPGAAMLGGVCGHAGVFSTADDLAKIMQMLLNGGDYGNQRFFEPTTIKHFTTAHFLENNNRRGLGFDKPQMNYDKVGPTCQCVSAQSYGHSGFTGTLVWVDPEEHVLYIFLSNRIHPDQDNTRLIQENTRTEIQQAIYDAITTRYGQAPKSQK